MTTCQSLGFAYCTSYPKDGSSSNTAHPSTMMGIWFSMNSGERAPCTEWPKPHPDVLVFCLDGSHCGGVVTVVGLSLMKADRPQEAEVIFFIYSIEIRPIEALQATLSTVSTLLWRYFLQK